MRLRRLALTRFGRFDGFEIDFGPKPAEGPDFHVIYGLNEAGKSTAHAALLRLLFGFPRIDQEPYAFRHGQDLEVAGLLEGVAGAPDGLVRRVKKGDALLDEAGRPLDPQLFAGALSGLDQAAFERVFALDRNGVERGGAEVQEAKGDAARLFFAARMGVADLTERLSRLEAEAEAIHRPRARKTLVRETTAELQRVVAELKRVEVTTADYEARRAERARRAEAVEAAAREVGAAKARLGELSRLGEARKALTAARRLREAAAEFADAPDWPGDPHPEGLSALGARRAAAEATLRALEERAERLASEREALPEDPAALAAAERLRALEAARSLAEGARRDHDKLRRSVEALAEEMRARLATATAAPPGDLPEALRLDPETVEGLRRTEGALQEAERDAREADAALTEARDELAALRREREGDLADPPLAPETAARLGAMDLDATLEAASAAREALDQRRRAADDALVALQLAGRSFTTPPETTLTEGRVRDDLVEAETARVEAERAGRALAEHEAALARDEAALAAAAAGIGDPGLLDAQAARAERDEAWRAHRAALDPVTADAFEAAMRRHDGAVDLRLAHGEALGKLAAERARLDQARQTRERLARDAEAAREAAEACAGRHTARLAELGLPEGLTLRELADWLGRARDAREALARLRAEERARAGALAALAAAADALRREAPEFEDLPDERAAAAARARLVAHGRAVEARRAAETALAAATAKVEKGEARLARAEAAVSERRKAWDAALAATLPPEPALRDPRQALPTLAALAADGARLAEARRRAAAMRHDAEAYVAELGPLLRELGEAPLGRGAETPLADRIDEALARDRSVRARLAAAERAEARRREIDGELGRVARDAEKERGALRAAAEAIALYARRFPDLPAEAPIEALERRVGAAREATRRRKDAQAAEAALARAAIEAGGSATDADWLEATTALDLDGETALAQAALDAAETRAREAGVELGRAEAALAAIDRSGAAARLRTEKAALEERLEEAALDWMRRRIGLRLAREAIDEHRRENRSAMMREAARAFAALTEDRYADLDSRSEGGRETLVARRVADDRFCRAEEMSEGTRMQLYFALRVAAYVDRVERGLPACPFIADDVFESFDDARTGAACGLMRALGSRGQTIYLTHHLAVVEQVRRDCGNEARIHRLPDPGAGRLADAAA